MLAIDIWASPVLRIRDNNCACYVILLKHKFSKLNFTSLRSYTDNHTN